MAVMHRMRERMKVIMLVTALTFVALMVFEWGMDLTGRSAEVFTGGELGRVNGEPITVDEFNLLYRNLLEQRERERGQPLSFAERRALEEEAWNQLVMQKLLNQELARRGIEVTRDEIVQAARFAPPPEFYENELFQTNGQFDLAKYQQFLTSAAVDDRLLLELEAYYREVIPRSKLFQQLVAGLYVPDGELWRMWRDENESVRVRYLALEPDRLVPDADAPVSRREVEAYYEAHRDEFRRPAEARIRVVALDRQPAPEDTAAARQKALRLRDEIRAGADFAEVARRESADSASAARGGELGEIRRGQTVPAFEQAVWSLPIGAVSEPVLTPFGFHLIRVDRREGDVVSARHILVPIRRSEASEQALLDRADSLEALGERMRLAEAARRLGLQPREATIHEELPFVPGIGRVDEAADWVFTEAQLGEVSPVFETETAYYMVELVARTPAGTLSLEQAEPAIRARLQAEKKLERARQIGRQLVDRLRRGEPMEQVAAATGLEVREAGPFTRQDLVPGLGRATPAIGAAFGLRPGQTSGVLDADGRLVILQVVERREADRQAFERQKEILRARAMAGLEQQRIAQFLADLKARADIVDRHKEVLRRPPPADTAAP